MEGERDTAIIDPAKDVKVLANQLVQQRAHRVMLANPDNSTQVISTEPFSSMISAMKNLLTYLDLNQNVYVKDEDLCAALSHYKLPNLETLLLCELGGYQMETVWNIIRAGKVIERFEMQNSQITSRALTTMGQMWPDLRRLCLKWCTIIDNDAAFSIANNMKNLRYLDITGAEIDNTGIHYLSALSHLQGIVVKHCKNVDHKCITILDNNRKMRLTTFKPPRGVDQAELCRAISLTGFKLTTIELGGGNRNLLKDEDLLEICKYGKTLYQSVTIYSPHDLTEKGIQSFLEKCKDVAEFNCNGIKLCKPFEESQEMNY